MQLPIPSQPGSYALHLRLTKSSRFSHDKLGEYLLPPGDLVYLGSAHGPGGLHARLGRHIRGNGKPRWHIDSLRKCADLISVYYLLEINRLRHPPLECAWSQALISSPHSAIPVPGFGASDCRFGCQAHLIAWNLPSSKMQMTKSLINQMGLPLINDPSEIVFIENILRYNK